MSKMINSSNINNYLIFNLLTQVDYHFLFRIILIYLFCGIAQKLLTTEFCHQIIYNENHQHKVYRNRISSNSFSY